MTNDLGSQQAYPDSIENGLTKRELFAAMAMQGICACPLEPDLGYEEMARYAVEAADALLTALQESKT